MLGRGDADEDPSHLRSTLHGGTASDPGHERRGHDTDDEARERGRDTQDETTAACAIRIGRCRDAGRGTGLVNPPQFARQIARALPALIGILRETAADDVIEQRGRQRLQLDDRGGLRL